MSATFDLRRPVVVVTGLFNPAIFSPEWAAANLYGIPSGETVNIAVGDGLGAGGATFFLNGVGISVGPTRLEFFSSSIDPEILKTVEQLVSKVFEVLPHTPFGALGINFGIIDAEPSDLLCSLFESKEEIEANFKVNSRTVKQSLALENGFLLNIERTLDDDGFFAALNFHLNDINIGNAAEVLAGILSKRLDDARTFAEKFYGLKDVGITSIPLPEM